MQSLASRVLALTGWRRYGLALVLGAAAALALPPFSLLPVLLVAFPGLLWLLDGAQRRYQAALVGWCFALGYFLLALHWLGNAFLVDADRFGALMPFAVFGMAAGLAFFPALAGFLAWALAPAGWHRLVALALAWTACEWLRGNLFTGFPWDPVGIVWIASEQMAQGYAYLGLYGVGFLTLLAALSPAYCRRRRQFWILGVVAGLLALAFIGGQARLASPPQNHVPGVMLRIVQPNIPQREKWRRDRRDANFQRLIDLSRAAGSDRVTHVIWPETATPFYAATNAVARRVMAKVVPAGGLLFTGAPRRSPADQTRPRIWNSMHAIDASGTVVATYDKHHLVPFGEYLPFRPLLSRIGIAKLVAGSVDYSAGPGPTLLNFDGLPPFQPLICYEAIFPGEIVRPRPAWLLNLTNDAWFGNNAGPEQHLALARVRALEQGVPLVRAANTGISAVVDPFGRLRARLATATAGIIDSPLPEALAAPPLYTRIGDWPLLVLSLAFVLSAVLRKRKQGSATLPH